MKITVCKYLVKKLCLLGIKDVFGLPGDYNFNILDAILQSKKLNWINCTNELNASYAADGYSRINGYGAVVTTYGVGELSAINGIAGSFAENLPVVHIVGVPKTSFIQNNVVVHHNFTKANYFAFKNVFENVTSAQAYLNFENAKSEIDRIIDTAKNTKMPVYIAIPVDVCEGLIEERGVDKFNEIQSDEENSNLAVEKIIELIKISKNPLFMADFLAKRFNLKKEIKCISLYIKTGVFLMGKGIIDENSPNFIGTYSGNFSSDCTLEAVQNSDLIITAGFLYADLNTGGFSTFSHGDIQINKNETIIKGKKFENVLIQDVIRLLAEKIKVLPQLPPSFSSQLPPSFLPQPKPDTSSCAQSQDFPPHKKLHYEAPFKQNSNTFSNKPAAGENSAENIKADCILTEIQTLLEPDDIFVMETGLLSLSGAFLKLEKNMEYLSQTLWGSIGWATPAAFGAMMAAKERNLILLTGEGAHQLTAQELANYFEYNLCPVIFVLNNGGYTVERVLSKNPNDKFNDITNWNYSKLLEVFSNGKDFYYKKIYTVEECRNTLNEIKKIKGKKLCYIEIFTDKMDITKISRQLVLNMKNFNQTLNPNRF